ncbi:glycoside-pentoside-hexuronide (GPH):cation symporter [Leuconostoc mesenteroides]|uniref:glycoside-pentoside-hexuronide (GPH):cation symporter n=1 Tax=Leuconostoc mesenteroides TaxID=1245 RepID=UPI000E092387|nr:glycoside-pentoside-hexuronide (GPH):cation symporter [Leuconostoc mesenteroides]RDF89411.1 PTS sugar transporter subunit IIA [Leuconostoc mesenteroides subsp. mesenteroides]
MKDITKQKFSRNKLVEMISFALGNLGHAAFYGALSTYFIVYVTSGMFDGLPQSVANKLIGLITALVVIIRLAEVIIDPILGNIVDNTKTRWGKFKPWQVIGAVVSSVLLVVIFTGIFGLAHINWIAFAIVFTVLFILLDIFYSFADVAYWGMVPAISEDSKERGIFTSLGSFTGSIGWNGLTMIVVPVTTYFTFIATGKHEQGPSGWFGFSIVVSIVAVLSALAVAFGTNEKDNLIRNAATKKTSIKDVFSGIIHNDQILWISLAYLMYSLAYVVTNGVLFYFFKFVLGKPNEFWIAGAIATVIGFSTAPLYPVLNKFITRKVLFSIGQMAMILSYLFFIFGKTNMMMVTIGLILFNFTFAQLVVVLSLTDSIEYGQLKNGNRNEAVVLAVRPMLDKITGAFSNGIVGIIAITAGMTGSATAGDISASKINTFEIYAFYTPLLFSILALVIFLWKVKITEKKHAEIVIELEETLSSGAKKDNTSEVNVELEEIFAPASGQKKLLNEVDGNTITGIGFAIDPEEGNLFAPFDGKVDFTFSTKHVLGVVSNNGLKAIIHVGIGTINMRGAGFVSHYVDGQLFKKGDLLMSFDKKLITKNGYQDDVIMYFTQPENIIDVQQIDNRVVKQGEQIAKLTFRSER